MAQKQYNTKSLQDRIGQLGPEEGGVGKAGLYRHPESGEEMHTLSDPLFGEAQSNAAVRLGFVRVRDSKPEELHSVELDAVGRAATDTDSLKGLSARVNALEGVQEENKRLTKELEDLRKTHQSGASTDSGAVAQSVEDAKTAAKDAVQDRGQGNTRSVVVPKAEDAPLRTPVSQDAGQPADSAKTDTVRDENKKSEGGEGGEGSDDEGDEKPLDKQNETELKQTAAVEGVDLSNAETVKAKRAAIQAHRDEAAKLAEGDNGEESENE